MKSLLKLICAGLMLFGVALAYAVPVFKNGDSVTLTASSGDFDMTGGGSVNIDSASGGAIEFTVCVFALAGSCGTGDLHITIDLYDNKIDLIATGSTSTAGNFMLDLSSLDFDPAAIITAVSPTADAFDINGDINVNFSTDSIQFVVDGGGAAIAGSGTSTNTFTVEATATDVPEPGTLLLLSMALAGVGFGRRRVR